MVVFPLVSIDYFICVSRQSSKYLPRLLSPQLLKRGSFSIEKSVLYRTKTKANLHSFLSSRIRFRIRESR